MSLILRGVHRGALVFWAIYMLFAQPGLPACWLEAVPCEFHIHFNEPQADTPHDHAYLIDEIMGVAPAPITFTGPAAELIFLLQLGGLLMIKKTQAARLDYARWQTLLEPPPPKLSPIQPALV
jgi:hypothetical protein